MRTRNGGWPFQEPPNCDFDININSPQADGLVFWLPLMGRPDRGYRDFAGGRHLSPGTDPLWVPDSHIGRALDIDTSSEVLYSASTPVTGYPLTLVARYKVHSIAANEQQCIIGVGDASVTDNYIIVYLRKSSSTETWYVYANCRSTSGSGSALYTFTDDPTGRWLTFAGVFKSATSRRAYLDAAYSSEGTVSVSPTGIDRIAIGGTPDSTVGMFTDGALSDLRIYNRALSDEEVAAISDPATKWELYQPRVPLWTVGAPAVEAAWIEFGAVMRGVLDGVMSGAR